MKKIKRIVKLKKKKNPFRNYKEDFPIEITIPVDKLIISGYSDKQSLTIKRGNNMAIYQFVKVNRDDFSVTYRRRRVIVNMNVPTKEEDEVIL